MTYLVSASISLLDMSRDSFANPLNASGCGARSDCLYLASTDFGVKPMNVHKAVMECRLTSIHLCEVELSLKYEKKKAGKWERTISSRTEVQ